MCGRSLLLVADGVCCLLVVVIPSCVPVSCLWLMVCVVGCGDPIMVRFSSVAACLAFCVRQLRISLADAFAFVGEPRRVALGRTNPVCSNENFRAWLMELEVKMNPSAGDSTMMKSWGNQRGGGRRGGR